MPAESRGQGDDDEDDLEIIETDSGKKEEQDEFDISDSDEGGLAKKIGNASKKPAKKPKKLTKMTDLFPSTSAGASKAKKPPGPTKTSQAAKKHKKSETQSESEKPVKKKAKIFETESEDDFVPSPPPKNKRGLSIVNSYRLFSILSKVVEGPNPSDTRSQKQTIKSGEFSSPTQ